MRTNMRATVLVAISAMAFGSCLNAPEDRNAISCVDVGCPLSGQTCVGGECGDPDCDETTPCPGYGGGSWDCQNQDGDVSALCPPGDSCDCVWPCASLEDCPGGSVCDDGRCVAESGAEVSIDESGLTPIGPFVTPPNPDPDPYYEKYDQFSR